MIEYTEEFKDAIKALDDAHQEICCKKEWSEFDTETANLIEAAYEVNHLFCCHEITQENKKTSLAN